MNLFDPFGPFVVYGTKLFNILFVNTLLLGLAALLLSVHWAFALLTGILLVCLYKVAHGGIAPGYGFGPAYFIRPLKQLKQRWVVIIFGSLFNMFIIGAAIWALYMLFTGLMDMPLMIPVYALILIEGIIISFYAMPLIAHTQMGLTDVFKYAFALAHKHLLFSFMFLILTVALVIAINYYWFLILLLPAALMACISYYVTQVVFPKYDLEQYGLDLEH